MIHIKSFFVLMKLIMTILQKCYQSLFHTKGLFVQHRFSCEDADDVNH